MKEYQVSIEEYEEGHPFPGIVARTVEGSKPAWPAPRRSREGSPNILFVVLDDVGYGQLSCYGGLVDTPNIDRIAASGLRYANMHTTALCSPTRSIITPTALPASWNWLRASRATTVGCRSKTGCCPRSSLNRDTTLSRLVSGTSPRRRTIPRRVRSIAGRWVAGSNVSMDSSAAKQTNGIQT